jgi:hypothetical protein
MKKRIATKKLSLGTETLRALTQELRQVGGAIKASNTAPVCIVSNPLGGTCGCPPVFTDAGVCTSAFLC